MPHSYLQKGDTIGIIAPSGYCSPKALEAANKYLEKRGYNTFIQKGLLKKHLHFANTDEKRLKTLKEVLQKKEVKAIWSLRGGSGAQRLIPDLMRLKKPNTKKLFIGFSDNSSLHYLFNHKWNWPSLHAPVLNRMILNSQPAREEKMLWEQISGDKQDLILSGLKAMNEDAKRKSKLQGKIVGGNLTTLHALLGSPLGFSAKNRILFLEDVGERPYRIDRSLVSMHQAGVFKSCRAIVFGDFSNCESLKGQTNLNATLDAFAKEMKIPVFKGIKAGHGSFQSPLWFNTNSQIKKNQLIMENPLK